MNAKVTVVLVRTYSPGNLGAATRAAANFGARLALVDPRAALDHPDVTAHASGAEATLAKAKTFASLTSLGGEFDLVVALTSERGRTVRGLPPRATPPELRRAIANGQSIALVFGPERSGLRTEEVLDCDRRWSLPTEDAFPTLNLAQAVAVALALLRPSPRASMRREPLGDVVRRATWRRLQVAFRAALESRFETSPRRPAVTDELLGLLRRARPTQREAELLLAYLSRPERRGR